jgi:hypothetical protein
MEIGGVLAIWGALLSTVLAGVKLWEMHRARPRITTSYSLSAPDQGGNQIILENASSTPVMVSYWELHLRKRKGFRVETVSGRFPNEGYCNITIGAHSRHVLSFEDEEYFSWGVSEQDGAVWWLKLHIVGRGRPVWLRVYPKD